MPFTKQNLYTKLKWYKISELPRRINKLAKLISIKFS